MSRSLTMPEVGRVAVADTQPSEPTHGEVRVRVERCGICGSDLHTFRGHSPLSPVCPGHEISATVDAVGDGVEGWSAGDPVVVEPLARCGSCAWCQAGNYHMCSRIQVYGVHRSGGMASHMVVPDYTLYRRPARVDGELGALAEPVAVTVHAARLAGVEPGSRVLVLGAGTIGLVASAAARHLGAEHVSITARHPHQKELAQRLGCDEVLDPADPRGAGARPDVVIETVGGTAPTFNDAVSVVRRAGTVVIVGLFEQAPAFDPMTMMVKEVRVVSSMVYNRSGEESDFDTALAVLDDRADDLRAMVTHTFGLADAQQAFETADDKKSGAVKVLLSPND